MFQTADELPASRAHACPLCGRASALTFHHLIPRKMHRRSYFKRHYDKRELQRGIMICRPCHSALHKFHDEMTLAKQFNTLEALRADATLRKHFAWVAKQKIRT